MNRIIVIFLNIFLGIQTHAWAVTDTVSAKTTVYSVHNVFQKKNSNAHYEVVSQETQLRFQVVGTGGLSSLNQDNSETEKSVLGVDLRGHYYVSLEKNSNQIYMIIDAALDDTIQGIPINMKERYKIPMEYTKGSWEDYAAGKPVELRPTKQGENALAESYTSVPKQLFKNLRDGFQKIADGKAKVGEFKVDRVTTQGESYLSGDLNRLELKSVGETVISLSFDFSTI